MLQIGEWLPDGQSFIAIKGNAEAELQNFEELYQVNRVTGETTIFGRRRQASGDPRPEWLPDVQKLVFKGIPDECGIEAPCPPPELWITSAGTITLTTPVLDNVKAFASQGHRVIALQSGNPQPILIEAESGEKRTLAVNLATFGVDTTSRYVHMAWRPHYPEVAIFSKGASLLLNVDTEEVQM
jgi:hypothetical protein